MRAVHTPNPFKSYRQVATQTAPPGQLVLMLFDGALKSLDCALLGFKCEDFAERNLAVHNNLTRALDIIRELNGSLDMAAGGQLAETLRGLYVYFEQRINAGNFKKSPEPIREITPMLKELRDSWFTMLTQQDGDLSAASSVEINRAASSRFTV
ncbi:MAG TPA: flagellar export chaperone FliS [Candidatus Acidoferrales bacterium]|jgi:flagellar protein FliS|nr:flagellar export chaperone FliS [Candidatus Acidoferrales bacterium]